MRRRMLNSSNSGPDMARILVVTAADRETAIRGAVAVFGVQRRDVYVLDSIEKTRGLTVLDSDVIHRLNPAPDDDRRINAALHMRRAFSRPETPPQPTAILSAVVSGVRSTGRRPVILGPVEDTVAQLDALHVGAVVRGLETGVVYEASTVSGERMWFTTGNECEDTTQYLADYDGAGWAVLYVPERTQADTRAAA